MQRSRQTYYICSRSMSVRSTFRLYIHIATEREKKSYTFCIYLFLSIGKHQTQFYYWTSNILHINLHMHSIFDRRLLIDQYQWMGKPLRAEKFFIFFSFANQFRDIALLVANGARASIQFWNPKYIMRACISHIHTKTQRSKRAQATEHIYIFNRQEKHV